MKTTRTTLLTGLVVIGISASGASRAFGQQNIHVVPSPQVLNATLTGSAAITDNDIWAVGNMFQTDTTFAEHFNGSSWSLVATPNVKGGEFQSMDAAANNDVWAVGYQSAGSSITTLTEHWNGASWSVVSSPRVGHGAFLRTVTAVSATDAWAAGPSTTCRRS
jgi:hypothetical protein